MVSRIMNKNGEECRRVLSGALGGETRESSVGGRNGVQIPPDEFVVVIIHCC